APGDPTSETVSPVGFKGCHHRAAPVRKAGWAWISGTGFLQNDAFKNLAAGSRWSVDYET
ncbi:hypothetical protein, partial [Mesorhizobium sp. M7A.F.Ca.ET.027.03.2.1]|uniref:hypothetical protein n=1 Tax=Mesorhizobium sp. M7A.F.Ca.ET.027.03.2.1 TaxID=2496656 RepID=UPI001AECF9A7